ncbi:hypothetical protein BCR36DRAFT_331995 [Piromyces finnis]|uniref:Beta-xylanase n=1 Tax=Piromyces finnis TaxID=1754191 RepID=A0A1Y1V3V9_9FUNG|nr:hypothetical protein BCR36DRAFT_331995 [Piromyces finnis]|eukprot:ORX46469.1 hypothetical protein BCR36DRAFT_331995 [Piromyces finnis]
MRSYLKKISILAIAAAAASAELVKRDPYWIKMADVIQQVRPDFYYGVATTKSFFSNPKYKDIISTYNLHTGGNECKFYTIQGTQTFNTKQCDDSIAFAKKFGAKFRGHNLFWPANSPDWFKNYSDDIEEVKAYYLDYVAKVLDHYKDEEDIIYWDVVNESVTDDSTIDKYKLRYGSDRSNEFKGWDTYTEDIFTLAREHTNPNVKLIYNDYNAENNNGNFNGKTGAVYKYIKEMKEKGIPIDGVGLQMHISCNYTPNYEQLTELIDMYKEIGVEVHVTEIDVSMKNCKTHDQQRKLYMDVFRACFDNENCKVFTVWGAYDTESWIGASNVPLPFDDDMYPKDIYFDMLEYVMKQLPEDATYPTPTVTKPVAEPTSAENELKNAKYIVKPGEFMLNAAWQDWSWGNDENSFDDDGNYQATFQEEKYGALSLHTGDTFNAGKLHLELKSDTEGAPINIVVHTIEGNEFVTLETISSPSTEELEAYDIDVPAVSGDNYNRISIQDAWGKAITVTVNNIYFIPSEVPQENKPINTNGERYDLVKEGDYMINPKWQNWSWGVENSEFDDDGNMVNYIAAGTYGGVSFKRGDSNTFGKGTFHFKAMVNDTNAQIQVLFHTTADEYVAIGSVSDLSDSELVEYTLEVDEPTAEKYDRFTIQDVANNGLVLTLNDVYFISAASEAPETSVNTDGERYDIVKEGDYMIDAKWQNWSWGVEDNEFDDDGNMVNYITAGTWGGVSFKRGDSTLFGKGIFHFKAMVNDTNAQIQVLFHTTADEYVAIGSVSDLSDSELVEYTLEVDEPVAEMYDRITIQDVANNGLVLTLNDVYFISTPAESVEEPSTTEPVEEPTATESVQEPTEPAVEPEIKGTKYDIVKEGAVNSEWQNWSWGVNDSEIDENGAMANELNAGDWAGVSFKRSDTTKFGKFTLYFKAMVSDPKAVIQVILHNSADEDDSLNVGSFKGLSDSEMKEYTLEIDEEAKYDRITIQDIYNKGYTLYLNDVFIVIPEQESEPSTDEVSGTKYDIIKEGAVTSEWMNWSWGINDSEIDENGAMANELNAGDWAGVSFKRSDTTKFGKFTLYFKAMVSDPKAVIQVVVHNSSEEDDYTTVGSFKGLSDSEMKEYSLEVDVDAKYDRITIQDIYNKGYTLYINDVYIVVPEKEDEPIDENCWASALGFTCCKATKTVVMEDADGAWGVEDGFWCGIVEDTEDTCWSSKIGYPCCKENNVIYAIDSQGSWGYENDSWCGISKVNEECEFNTLGYSCCPDATVVYEDDHKWGYVNNHWCGVTF